MSFSISLAGLVDIHSEQSQETLARHQALQMGLGKRDVIIKRGSTVSGWEQRDIPSVARPSVVENIEYAMICYFCGSRAGISDPAG